MGLYGSGTVWEAGGREDDSGELPLPCLAALAWCLAA